MFSNTTLLHTAAFAIALVIILPIRSMNSKSLCRIFSLEGIILSEERKKGKIGLNIVFGPACVGVFHLLGLDHSTSHFFSAGFGGASERCLIVVGVKRMM